MEVQVAAAAYIYLHLAYENRTQRRRLRWWETGGNVLPVHTIGPRTRHRIDVLLDILPKNCLKSAHFPARPEVHSDALFGYRPYYRTSSHPLAPSCSVRGLVRVKV